MVGLKVFIDVEGPLARCRQTLYPKIIISSCLGTWGTEGAILLWRFLPTLS